MEFRVLWRCIAGMTLTIILLATGHSLLAFLAGVYTLRWMADALEWG